MILDSKPHLHFLILIIELIGWCISLSYKDWPCGRQMCTVQTWGSCCPPSRAGVAWVHGIHQPRGSRIVPLFSSHSPTTEVITPLLFSDQLLRTTSNKHIKLTKKQTKKTIYLFPGMSADIFISYNKNNKLIFFNLGY